MNYRALVPLPASWGPGTLLEGSLNIRTVEGVNSIPAQLTRSTGTLLPRVYNMTMSPLILYIKYFEYNVYITFIFFFT